MSWFVSVRDFMMIFHAFWTPYEISLWDFLLFAAYYVYGICRDMCDSSRLWVKFAFFFCHYEIFCVSLLNFRLRLPYEIVCCIISLRDVLMRFHAFLPSWDVLMRFVALCCILFWCDFFMRFHAFWPSCFVAVMRYPCEIFNAFCCTIFVRDILMGFHAFLGRYELCVWDFMLVGPWCNFLMRFHAFWLPNFCFDGVM